VKIGLAQVALQVPFFLTVGQNNFGNKIAISRLQANSTLQVQHDETDFFLLLSGQRFD
jgi:hypothetical protein